MNAVKIKKSDVTLTLMNGICDKFSNVETVVTDTMIQINQANGRSVIYPMVNVARIAYSESK